MKAAAMKSPIPRLTSDIRQFGSQLLLAWNTRPTIATIPLGLIVFGSVALVRGDNVSRAFTDLGGGTLIRFLGFMMVLGGFLFAVSVFNDNAMYEVMGLSATCIGVTMYGLGVIAGLGEQGIMASGGYLLIALGFVGRIRLQLHKARREEQQRRRSP